MALRRVVTVGREEGLLDVTLLLLNGGSDAVRFTLPAPALHWTVLVDSASDTLDHGAPDPGMVRVEAHGVLLLGAYLETPT